MVNFAEPARTSRPHRRAGGRSLQTRPLSVLTVMTIINKAIYDAFIDAGASDTVATAAAKSVVAGHDHIDRRFKKIQSDVRILKWAVAFILVVNLWAI